MLDRGYELCFILVRCLYIMASHLHFGVYCPKDIVQDNLWFVEMQLCKLKLYCHVVFREKRVSPGSPCKQAVLVQFLFCHEL